MRCTKGNKANTVMTDRVILTELDSSNHTYKSSCVISETMPATRENTPAICGEEMGSLIMHTATHNAT